MLNTEVLIIGGGATGAGLARDLALRGLRTILVERHDLSSGTSGRNHGLLHSGGRYVVTDPESARECAQENVILKRVARHTIDACGGMFVLPSTGASTYLEQFLQGCRACSIPTEQLTGTEARKLEHSLSPAITDAVLVPDGAVDPFQLVTANAMDASRHGAEIRTYHRVVGFQIEDGQIRGTRIRKENGAEEIVKADMVINVAGAWAGEIAAMAGLHLPLQPSAGALLIAGRRMTGRVINHLRPPSDGDIIVPHHTTTLIGTTSRSIAFPDDTRTTREDVETIIREIAVLVPAIKSSRLIRAFSGVRPLLAAPISPGPDAHSSSGSLQEPRNDDRALSRSFQIIMNNREGTGSGTAQGPGNMITIIGGKLTTYRLMAERCADLVCAWLGTRASCVTHHEPLPGAEEDVPIDTLETLGLYPMTKQRIVARYGTLMDEIFKRSTGSAPISTPGPKIVCECENVTTNEVLWAVKQSGTLKLGDILRRTRAGMGMCQGGRCAAEIMGYLVEQLDIPPETAIKELMVFMNARYHGIRPILWGEQLRQERFIEALFSGVGNLDQLDAILTSKRESLSEAEPEAPGGGA